MHGIWISDASRRKIIEDKLKGHNSRCREAVSHLIWSAAARYSATALSLLDEFNHQTKAASRSTLPPHSKSLKVFHEHDVPVEVVDLAEDERLPIGGNIQDYSPGTS